jgi:cytochrome P450
MIETTSQQESPCHLTGHLTGMSALKAFWGYYFNPLDTTDRVARSFGDAVAISNPISGTDKPPIAFFFSGAKANKAVYREWDNLRMCRLWPVKAPSHAAQTRIRFNYMCMSGEAHRAIAAQIEAPMMRPRIRTMISEAHKIMAPMMEEVLALERFDIEAFSIRMSIQVTMKQLFGEADPKRAERIGDLVNSFSLANYRKINMFLRVNMMPFPYFQLLRDAEALEAELMVWLEEAAYQKNTDNLRSAVSLLRMENGASATTEFKVACLGTLVWAAYDTPALAVLWTIILLSRNPTAAERLAEELSAKPVSEATSVQDLHALPYLNSVVHESLRLLPPGPFIPLKAVRSFSVGSIMIPKDASIILSPRATQRDSKLYPDPETFRPERWTHTPTPDAYEFITFSGGVRRCPGASYATLYVKLAIAMLVMRGGVNVNYNGPVPVRCAPTMMPRKPVYGHGKRGLSANDAAIE